jgi:hypothetical protein
MGTEMKFARKTDFIIIVILVAAGIIAWAFYQGVFNRSGTAAEIYYNSERVMTVDLSQGKDESFSLKEVPGIVFHKFPDGSISFIESDCPDKVCVKTGRLHSVGQMAACLPNKVYIKIVGKGSSNTSAPDVVIG